MGQSKDLNIKQKNESMLDFTINLAKEAGKLVKENYGEIKSKELKADDSFVTNVDKESERIIISRIKEKYPGHSILSEESGEEKKKSEYMWIIDPIDGTSNFIHGLHFFSVSIGIVKDSRPYIGVLYFPALDELYYAERGKGAYLNGKKIRVSDKGLQDGPILAYGANIEKGTEWHMKKLPELLRLIKRIRMFGNATTNMGYIAAGRFDAFIGRFGHIWDYAASLIITEEAGGKVTDLEGKPYTLETTDFVASNGKFHDELIKITRSRTE